MDTTKQNDNQVKHTPIKEVSVNHGKQLVYAGLATMTLAGAVGSTSVTLADATVDHETTSMTMKKQTKKMKLAVKKATATAKNSAKKIEKKAKAARIGVAHTFVRSDFIIQNIGGKQTIIGFNTANFDPDDDWDGNLSFSAEFNDIQVIGDSAFEGNQVITAVDLKTLPNLEIIESDAFENCQNLVNVDFSNLAKLTRINAYAFNRCASLKTVNLIDLPSLRAIEGGNFSDTEGLETVNLINLPALTYMGSDLFENTPNLQTISFISLTALQELGDSEWFYETGMKTISLIDMPQLTTLAGSLVGLLNSLEKIYVGGLSPDFEMEDNEFDEVKPGGLVIPVTSGDVSVAQMFVDKINENCKFTTQQDKWALGGEVTYKYVDQNDIEITTDTNNDAVVPYTKTGRVGDEYGIALPNIAGYGDAQVITGTAQGTLPFGMQTVVIKYRAIAPIFTVYTVDKQDNELAAPQEFSGFIGDNLSLRPAEIAGYDFKGLFGSVTNASRAVADYQWEAIDQQVIGSSIDYMENAGRSYKFVYDVTPAPVEKPVDQMPKPAKPESGADTNKPVVIAEDKPAVTPDDNKEPTADENTEKEPGGLPISGGEQVNKNGTTKNKRNVTTTKNGATKADETVLPKSGTRNNAVLPVVGVTLLAGIIGAYALIKKRKS